MKLLDVALKDIRRSFSSAFFLVFGLVLPLLTTGLFYFAFGGPGSDGDGFDLPATSVQLVNLDQAGSQYGGFSAGQLLVEFLQAEQLADLLVVTEAEDAAAARAAVDRQEAGVVVIIPAGFTAAVFDPEGRAAVEVYRDPTLTLGPSIVEGIASQFVDGLAGSKIAALVAHEQLVAHGAVADAAVLQDIAVEYGGWVAGLAEGQTDGSLLLDARPPVGAEEGGAAGTALILGLAMAGMMVFYVFFAGAASAQSILQEEEEGTLPRLFTTPTSQSAILGGKCVSVFAVLIVQVAVLLVASSLVFGIEWGEPLPVAVVALGMIVLAAGFGIFVASLLKDTKQSGVIYGGVFTVAGMLAMISTFTHGTPTSALFAKISLLVPQGWGVRGWRLLLEGSGMGDVLPTVAVMLGLGVGFFVFAVFKFRKRFA